MLVTPYICSDDIFRLLKEQQAKRILYISETGKKSDDLYALLSSKLGKNAKIDTISFKHYDCPKLTQGWHVILVRGELVSVDKNIIETMKQLIGYAKQSVMVISPMYISNNCEPTDFKDGIRYLYPTLFQEFDYTYQEYIDDVTEKKWQIYNFYTRNDFKSTMFLDQVSYSKDIFLERKLNIVYALPHLNLTGGLKYLMTHAKFLFERGHNVYLMYLGGGSAIPSWSGLSQENITGQIYVSSDEDLSDSLKKYEIDAIIVGFYTQLNKLVKCDIPILYWEQGSETLYGDWGTVQSHNSPLLNEIREIYRLPITIASVSPIVSNVLKARYGRITPLLYSGIDTEFYKPSNEDCEKRHGGYLRILLVGYPGLLFKGFFMIVEVLRQLWDNGYRFQVTWASQGQFTIDVPFPVDILVNLSQNALAELYRESDILISGSVYESFPMPPMEAFASGTAVASTDNGGIHVYAKPGINILLAEQGNFFDLYTAIEYLIKYPEIRNKLAQEGRKESLKFSINHSIDQLENILYNIVANNTKENRTSPTLEKDLKYCASECCSVKSFPYPINKMSDYITLENMIKTGEGLEAVISFPEQKNLISRLQVLANLCKDKSVIHIGCTDHIPLIKKKRENNFWLHDVLSGSCSEVLGIDINEEAIHFVKTLGIDNILYGDITQPGIKSIMKRHWDYILFPEVIEHMTDPSGFLRSIIKNYATYTDYFIFTVPNAFGLPFLATAIQNGEERINPDHKFWYTPYTLWKILESSGLNVISLYTCAYEASYSYLKQNESLVLKYPILQDTIIAIACTKK